MQLEFPHYPTPAELEQFYIPFPDGDPAARIGLRLSFYFRRLGEADLRKPLAACIQHYLALAGDRIQLYAFANDRKFRKLKPGQHIEVQKFQEMIDPESDFNFEASATEVGIAQHWSISVMSSRIKFSEDELGYFLAYLPFTALENAPPRSFTKLFLQICNALAVEHAYGGLGWVLPFDPSGRRAALELPLLGEQAMRFCALDVDDPNGTLIHCKQGIKSINWLTAVSNRLLERMDGADSVLRMAGHGVESHPYGNGMVFQAGSSPQIGDTVQGVIPQAYLALGKALKPLRAEYPWPIFTAPPGYPFPSHVDPDIAFSQRWLARFDGG
jgi:hypothetical protein